MVVVFERTGYFGFEERIILCAMTKLAAFFTINAIREFTSNRIRLIIAHKNQQLTNLHATPTQLSSLTIGPKFKKYI